MPLCPIALGCDGQFCHPREYQAISQACRRSRRIAERSRIRKLLAEEREQGHSGRAAKATLRKDDRPSMRRPRIRSSMMEKGSAVATSRKAADPPANRLLGLLPPKDYARLRPHLRRIPLEYRQSLYRAHQPIGFVYFIETGVGSLVNTMANGQASEVGTIGNEGVVGLPLVLGDGRPAAGGPHPLPTRQCHDHRPPRPGSRLRIRQGNSLPTLLPTEPAAGHLRDKASVSKAVIFM